MITKIKLNKQAIKVLEKKPLTVFALEAITYSGVATADQARWMAIQVLGNMGIKFEV